MIIASGVPGQSSPSMLQVLWSPPRTRYLSSCSYRTICDGSWSCSDPYLGWRDSSIYASVKNTNAATNLIEEVLLDKTYSTTLTEGVYEFKVQGVCGIQQTSWSQTAIVVIGGSDDEAIGHYAPVDSSCTNSISPRIIQATKNSVTLKWNKGSGAENFTIEVIDVAHPEVYRYITTQYTDTTITITGLLPNNVYNIFVKTICGTGVSQRTSHTIVTTPATNSTATSKFDCDAPPGLAVNFISATSALVSWGQ